VRFPILRLGVASTDNSNRELRANLNKVGHALGYELGTAVKCQIEPSHARLLGLLAQGQLDAAWVPPVVALDCVEKRVARPTLALVRQDATMYHSVLFSLDNTKIKSLADLHDVRAAWVGPESASGYLVPMASLRTMGVSLFKAFSKQTFLGSHDAVTQAVADGTADIGASYAHFDPADTHRMVSASWTEHKVDASFRVLFAAGPIPSDVIVTHRSMYEGHQHALVAAFDWLATRPEIEAARAVFRCDGFRSCGEEHLRGLGKLIRLIDRPTLD